MPVETREELACQLLRHVADHWKDLESDLDTAPHEDINSLCSRIGHRGGLHTETHFPTKLWIMEVLRLPHFLLGRESPSHSAEFYALLISELLKKAEPYPELSIFFKAFCDKHSYTRFF